MLMSRQIKPLIMRQRAFAFKHPWKWRTGLMCSLKCTPETLTCSSLELITTRWAFSSWQYLSASGQVFPVLENQ